MMRKGIVFGLTAAMVLSLTACGGGKTETTKAQEETSGGKSSFSVAMITDTGGINDQSFNQSAWEGLTELKNKTGADVNYIESKQASDFVTNLERLGDSGANLLWGVATPVPMQCWRQPAAILISSMRSLTMLMRIHLPM